MKTIVSETNNDGIIYRVMEDSTLLLSIFPLTRYCGDIAMDKLMDCRRVLNHLHELEDQIEPDALNSLQVMAVDFFLKDYL